MTKNEKKQTLPKMNGFEQEQIKEMKKTITENGKTKTIRLDPADTYILRWVVNLFKSPTAKKKTIDGAEYVWIKHGYLAECFPALKLTAITAGERLKKLVTLDILTYKLIKVGGTFSYYGIGKNYYKLVSKNYGDGIGKSTDGLGDEADRVYPDNPDGVPQESEVKDINLKDNIIRDKSKDMCDVTKYITTHTDTLSYNASYMRFIKDFGIIEDDKNKAKNLDFDKLYDAYVESANFLQQRPQPKFLSWIVKNYEKIVNGFYKDIASKQKGKTASEIWREIYEEEKSKEEAERGGI